MESKYSGHFGEVQKLLDEAKTLKELQYQVSQLTESRDFWKAKYYEIMKLGGDNDN